MLEKVKIDTAKYFARKKIAKSLDFVSFKKDDRAAYLKANKKNILLYLHIPFCKNFCPYCSFHKFHYDEKRMREYFIFLKKEIDIAYKKGFDFHSLYIGGGTPTLLVDELAELIEFCQERFSLQSVSCETDPNFTNVKPLRDKIDRLSVGLQTFNDDRLKKMGRVQKFGNVEEQKAKIAQMIETFPIVNVDLIFNLPGQSKEVILHDLEEVIKLSPQQVSIYPLMASPLVIKNIRKRLGEVDESRELDYYLLILKKMDSQYKELSCWSFGKSAEIFDEYVVDNDDYLGLGCGAFSFIDGVLYINEFSLDGYEEIVKKGSLSIRQYRSYTPIDVYHYRLMLRLFSFRYGKEWVDERFRWLYEAEMFALHALGFMERGELNSLGKFLFMSFMKEFYIGMDGVREILRKGIDKYGMRIENGA